jgi:hypothetical protein
MEIIMSAKKDDTGNRDDSQKITNDVSSSLKQIPEEFCFSGDDANESRVISLKTTARMKGLLDLVLRKEKERDRQRTMITLVNEALASLVLKKLREHGYDTSSLRLP